MVKVITYGTYDVLHYGHILLLKRAKALGDYLIVGVTADSFDKARGKINVQQSLMDRIEAVKATGIADEIIIEEYEGQKIDDIRRYGIDIFTVGSDWNGKFDYLNEYCKVVYLTRTEGVSSSEIRSERQTIRLGLVGESDVLNKFHHECSFVDGIVVDSVCTRDNEVLSAELRQLPLFDSSEYNSFLDRIDAVYIISHPADHYAQIKTALQKKKHVLCEAPVTMDRCKFEELSILARENDCVLMDALKTAYSLAYNRLLLLLKSGVIGDIISVDTVCTSLKNTEKEMITWNSICAWGPIALLPIFQILGTHYVDKRIITHIQNHATCFDTFTKIDFIYKNAVASLKVGKGIKSEGEMIISGTNGYVYVPAPWWKTDYFEIRFENAINNKRYFYQLDGEGIRYEILSFVKAIVTKRNYSYITFDISKQIINVIEDFYLNRDVYFI